MKEELITFETAVLAKEKGFNEEVLCHYKNDGLDWFLDELKNSDLERSEYSRPTQSLLQKWLREKHIIDTNPICNYHHQKGRMYHAGIIFINAKGEVDIIIIPETDKSLDTIHRYYKSYEKAIEEALQEALKLIK
jgi:hypothetical protein